MNKEWIELKKKEALKKYEELKPIFIKNILNKFSYLTREDVENMLNNCISKDCYDMKMSFSMMVKDKVFELYRRRLLCQLNR